MNCELCAVCMICNTSIPLTMKEQEDLKYGHYEMRICDDCRKAIEWAKVKMKAEPC